jgi:two-component system, sensor histidine kinase and response regulator
MPASGSLRAQLPFLNAPHDRGGIARGAMTPWRIRTSLAMLVLACLLPGVLMSAYFIVAQYQQDKAKAIRNVIATARAVAASMDRDLSNIESGLNVLASSSALEDDDLISFYQQAHKALPYQHINNYVLIDGAGRQLINTLKPLGGALPAVGGPPQLLRVTEVAKPVLTDIFVGPVTQRPIVALGIPVMRQGRVVYSLSAGIFPERLAELLRAQQLPDSWISAVLDSQGKVVARSRDMARYVGQSAVPDLVAQARERREGVIETKTLDGTPVITAFSRSKLYGWSVAVGLPRHELTGEFFRSLLLLLTLHGVVFAGALWLAWRLAYTRVVWPAEHLLSRMRLASLGKDPGPAKGAMGCTEFVMLERGFSDMGDQLRQREQEREAYRVAEASNRAKTEFLSRMSHELRTPLNAVLGFTQVLKLDKREPLTAHQAVMLDHIESSGRHLLAMITDVLDVSRIESGTMQVVPEQVPLAPLLTECHSMVAASAEAAGLTIKLDVPEDIGTVWADKTRLKQVLINLLSNAIKYNQPGGQVVLNAAPSARGIRLAVSDTGIGLSAEQLQHLFEPFNRLGREQSGAPGTGIGLVICQRLVQMMGGVMAVTSVEHRGTTFSVEMPTTP